ncbi:MAG: Modification methylase MjaV [Candidatus Heimdallarchaeota archaeon LC_3]|nr:MAG: Modification methylase MjaV [Candidatus Heimdallarchaeota archaeon LC_3]
MLLNSTDIEEIENQRIFYKSSEDMVELTDNSIDLIITSPPYNRGKVYSDDTKIIYNDKRKIEDYLTFLEKVWRECYRVLKETGVFFLNIGDAAQDQGKSELVIESAVKTGFKRIQTIIWVKSLLGKGHYTPTGGNKRLNNVWENIFLLVKNKEKYKIYPKEIGIPYADKSNIGRYSSEDIRDQGNIWLLPYSKTTGASIKKGHDAPFPLELPIKCIKLTHAEKVLDPFLGSGTTLGAAKLLGLKGFGYENYPRKELIRNTITNSALPENNEILIPHLELAVDFFSSLIDSKKDKFDILNIFKNTKKQEKELKIVKSVLQSKNGSNEVVNSLVKLYDKNKEIKGNKLSKYFDKN